MGSGLILGTGEWRRSTGDDPGHGGMGKHWANPGQKGGEHWGLGKHWGESWALGKGEALGRGRGKHRGGGAEGGEESTGKGK